MRGTVELLLVELHLAEEGDDQHGRQAADDDVDHIGHTEYVGNYELHCAALSLPIIKVK